MPAKKARSSFKKYANERTYEGWDAQNDEYGNMIKKGIVDPTKVARLTIELSASIAALLLTTEAIITDEAEEKTPAGPSMPSDY